MFNPKLNIYIYTNSPFTMTGPDEKRLLIVDGHNSHFSMEFLHFCNENRIELFCLPPHTTHILQPLDVGLFAPLQSYYGHRVEEYLRLTGEAITKRNFLPYGYKFLYSS